MIKNTRHLNMKLDNDPDSDQEEMYRVSSDPRL